MVLSLFRNHSRSACWTDAPWSVEPSSMQIGRQGWRRFAGRPSWLIVVCVIIVRGVVCVPIVVVPGPRLDGVPDGITIVDGTCVDVVGGGVSLCCCCGHCCCHRCSVCVLPGRFMIGTMQGDDDNQHNQRLVFSMRLRVTTRNSAVIMCSRVHTISRIDTYGDENYYSRFPCPMMWANVGA